MRNDVMRWLVPLALAVGLMPAHAAIDAAIGSDGQLRIDVQHSRVIAQMAASPKRPFRVGPPLAREIGSAQASPARFMFVTLDKSSAKTSVEFGTCATVVRVRRNGHAVLVSMPLLYGKGSKSYVFRDGFVSEGGKLLK